MFLDGRHTSEGSRVEEVWASVVAALNRLFACKEGQVLVRLLTDAVAGAFPSLATVTRDWCDDIRAVSVARLWADEPGVDLDIADAAARFLASEFCCRLLPLPSLRVPVGALLGLHGHLV